MATNEATQTCPYCKETILADATKCKHCQSMILPKDPGHKGICPYCKESIKADALRCKHCKSDVSKRVNDCDCNANRVPFNVSARTIAGYQPQFKRTIGGLLPKAFDPQEQRVECHRIYYICGQGPDGYIWCYDVICDSDPFSIIR